jgi:signal transduction histidine kinase/DNA-binding response OmpR family regulator
MKNCRLQVIIIMIILNSNVHSQHRRQNALVQKDSISVHHLIQKGIEESDQVKKISYYKEAFSIAKNIQYDKGIEEATLKISVWNRDNLLIDSAIAYTKHGLASISSSSKSRAPLLIHMSDLFKRRSELDSAVFYAQKGIDFAAAANQNKDIVLGYLALGNFAFSKLDYPNAFINYAKADSICTADGQLNVSKEHARTYNYLGYAVYKTHGYYKAREFYYKSKNLYQQLNDEAGIQEVNIGIAQAYQTEGNYEAGLPLLNDAIAYHKKNGPLNSYTYAIIVRGYFLLLMKRYSEAEKDYLEYYEIAFKGKDRQLQCKAIEYLAHYYKTSKDYTKAIKYLNQVNSLYKEANDLERQKSVTEGLVALNIETNNQEALIKNYAALIELRNQIDANDRNKEIYELETKYQSEKKEQEIILLSTQNKLNELQRTHQRNLFISILGLLLLIGGFMSYGYRNKIKTTQKLKELDELKSRFFANISHEFRTPLTLIKSPLQLLQQNETSEEDKKSLSLIDKNANRMLTLVDQLLELSKLDSGNLKLLLKKENISSFLKSMAEPFAFEAEIRKIRFSSNIEIADNEIWFDRDVIEKIVGNLLSNALKYTPKNHRVKFEARIEKNELLIQILNSGVDLTPSEVSKLFERFYQQKETNEGAGIGLALVKELVTLYKGTVIPNIESNTLTFYVRLPLDKALLKEISVISEDSNVAHPTVSNENNTEELPILLIADDHAEIRLVIKDVFSKNYHVIEAQDGQEALKLALKEIPDIIISDVMMPKMNGYEVSKNIKQNEITSFIPIILLTAKTGDKAQLESLHNEVDAFITKPFNHEILKAKVHQLLEERRKLRERYSKELILKPKDIFIDSVDEKFVKRLQMILDEHLTNSSFSIDQFAKEAGMSRMQLHRKLKSVLGCSATEFLRNERLKAGAELLEKGNVTISEVAYTIGFNDVAYFSKCFKEIYNVTPTEYLSKG